VIHAAVEAVGGYAGHQRNTIDATRNVLAAMQAADCRQLVYVSSLSVLRPPRTPWERQTSARRWRHPTHDGSVRTPGGRPKPSGW